MDPRARDWYTRRTTSSSAWAPAALLERKAGTRVSVVIPARNEQDTVADVVTQIRRALMDEIPLVDELLVIDSMSTDGTAERAAAAGAQVRAVGDIAPGLERRAGKGEALWQSLFATSGDVLVYIDADLTEWGPHFVTGLLGPLLDDERTLLVRGFYDRVLDLGGEITTEGGRVTELVARPLLAQHWPQLGGVVEPLAGVWAAPRALMVQQPVPVGYGVEFSTLVDTARRFGLDAIAQVDLGRRAHRHQSVHNLGVMAAEILAVARRRSAAPYADEVWLPRPVREVPGGWDEVQVPTGERPPAVTVGQYATRQVRTW
jgi:glucosyl-3-phosphoglycerate synthase